MSAYVIGLTGGIASGKNAVAERLRILGASIVDADVVSRELMGPGSEILREIASAWGADVLRGDGSLNRPLLAERVFGQPEQVARLNAITHPPIMREMSRRVEAAPTPVAVLMAPLLLEAGGEDDVDEVWVVDAPPGLRVQRVMARDGATEAQALQRIGAQMDDETRKARADVVISNVGTPGDLLR
ncbi:MAG: dephospho-CoA kinase, partial [Armatimonadetes bacterium]|nr:dephospho-CoA kinase [Armatimonadota bacterium]